MFGVGLIEAIILGILCLVPTIAGIGVVVWLVTKNKRSSGENRDE